MELLVCCLPDCPPIASGMLMECRHMIFLATRVSANWQARCHTLMKAMWENQLYFLPLITLSDKNSFILLQNSTRHLHIKIYENVYTFFMHMSATPQNVVLHVHMLSKLTFLTNLNIVLWLLSLSTLITTTLSLTAVNI